MCVLHCLGASQGCAGTHGEAERGLDEELEEEPMEESDTDDLSDIDDEKEEDVSRFGFYDLNVDNQINFRRRTSHCLPRICRRR